MFLTAGACGPCRFGMYVTEYRKALRDAGFDGFRVHAVPADRAASSRPPARSVGLEMNPTFFIGDRSRRSSIGDVLNAHRLPHPPVRGRARRDRPGARGGQEDHLRRAREATTSLLRRCCKAADDLRARSRSTAPAPKPQVSHHRRVLGDDDRGRRQLQPAALPRAARAPSATSSSSTAWILYMHLGADAATRKQRADAARRGHGAQAASTGVDVAQEAGDAVARRARPSGRASRPSRTSIGLYGYHLPDMDESPRSAAPYYNNDLRGGEGHMEVGKLILNVVKSKAHMTLSREAVRLHAVVGRLRRRAVADHREVPAGHLLRDRDQRRRRGQRLLPRADVPVQGAARGAARSTRPCSTRPA